MFLERIKIVLGVVLVLAVAGSGAAWLGSRSSDSASAAGPPAKVVTSDKEPKPSEKKATEKKPDDTMKDSVRVSSADLRKTLGQMIDYPGQEGKEIKLSEVLEQLQRTYKVTFDINEITFKQWLPGQEVFDVKVADPIPIPPMKAPLQVILRKILSRIPAESPATYLVRKNRIEITTESAVRRELDLEEDERVMPLMTEIFRSELLATALEKLADSSGYSVILDPRNEKQGEKKVTATLRNVPIDTAVRLLADMNGLEVARLDNAFYITTPENAVKLREVRENRSVKKDPPRPGQAGP